MGLGGLIPELVAEAVLAFWVILCRRTAKGNGSDEMEDLNDPFAKPSLNKQDQVGSPRSKRGKYSWFPVKEAEIGDCQVPPAPPPAFALCLFPTRPKMHDKKSTSQDMARNSGEMTSAPPEPRRNAEGWRGQRMTSSVLPPLQQYCFLLYSFRT